MATTITVISQTEQDGLLPDGTYGQTVKITARTDGGSTFSVVVPALGYTAEKGRAALAAKAPEIVANEGHTFEV